jgi:alkylated DNA repair dioxygenase AlkB
VTTQFSLFADRPAMPAGFRYRTDVIAPSDEESLLRSVRALPFKNFEFKGYVGNRRVVSYGWKYDYSAELLRKSDDIPDFLLSVRETAAAFAGIAPESLQQALVTEYDVGAAIGWHRDKPMFGEIIGISLLSPCVFRLRRAVGDGWERASVTAEPRSAYLMSGPSRTEWEHSIPAVDALRYSITFRNFRADFNARTSTYPAAP